MSDKNREEIQHAIGAQGTLVLHDVAGSIRLRGTDTDEVHVVAQPSSGDRMPQLVVRKSEGALHIEPEERVLNLLGASFSRKAAIDFEVELPRAARVEINTVSADVDAAGLTGDQRYRTVSGDLELERTGGRISLTTVSGDVKLIASDALELEATTTSGDLELDAGILQLVRIRSVSGDARLKGAFRAGPEHGMETVSGDLRLEPRAGLTVETSRALEVSRGRRIVVGDGAALFRFRSMSGDVRVAGGSETHEQPAPARTPPARTPTAPAAPPEPPAVPERTDSLEILRALEAGEIDVEEATRRLEEVAPHA
jgi:hypothetical protein